MFLPRSLSSHRSTKSHSNDQSNPLPQPTATARQSAADEIPAEDPTILCALAFSDYELWSNPSLRDPNRDGFVPLRTVLHTSSVFLAANSTSLTEAAIVKSLRAHARDTFDIRMIVVDQTRSRRGHRGYYPAGGYEVRRKDWADVVQRFATFTPEYWDARTVYIENIPPSFRSVVGISKLLRSLLPKDRSSTSTCDYRFIQSIYFPPHYQDPPDARPKCKGFALLTFSEPSVASHFLAYFPYHRTPENKGRAIVSANPNNDHDEASPEELEARKAGFRTLSKERREALQSEYVQYRDALLHRIATSSSSTAPPVSASAPATVPDLPSPSPDDKDVPESDPRPSTTSEPSPLLIPRCYAYPPGCVIFVRHVPTDTNKTALRARFSALLAEDGNNNESTVTAALDYVDYTKGLDSCYLRLTTREHTSLLLKRFEQDAGPGQEIALELLDGRREEVYWKSVPEKVRALAVQRSQTAHKGQRGDGDAAMRADVEDPSRENGERKRRRRRR